MTLDQFAELMEWEPFNSHTHGPALMQAYALFVLAGTVQRVHEGEEETPYTKLIQRIAYELNEPEPDPGEVVATGPHEIGKLKDGTVLVQHTDGYVEYRRPK